MDGASSASFAASVAKLSGSFAIVALFPGWCGAAVDRVRAIPLVWRIVKAGQMHFAQEGRDLTLPSDRPTGIDRNQALAVALSGYTVGAATLYEEIGVLTPGNTVFRDGNAPPVVTSYHRFQPWLADQAPGDDDAERKRLCDLTLEILQDLIDDADGRTISVPLSAGLDSRLIAAGLRHLGYENVVCFAYGLKGNHEAETSKAIAARLGYPWRFVPYSNRSMARVYASESYQAYRHYADSLTGVHFPQDFAALVPLLEDGYLPRDCILVNGQSGDFITGNHVPAALAGPADTSDRDARIDRVIDALIAKHYKQWRFLMRGDLLATVRALIKAEILHLTEGRLPDDSSADYGIYEACEFVDRQSKYVVNGQRIYEFLGMDWRLPLWDDRYLDYWAQRPAAQKLGQRLYREMLIAENWGGVWTDIPVNKKRIRPRWIIPFRLACKVAHAPLGAARWHRFERRVFEYAMTSLCSYAVRGWSDIAFDSRGPWTAISPHIEDYLADHGVSLESLSR
ncbi:asparagine synthase [Rhodospirillaceae bacterium KN72]|uniref:asparagine synthase (glutamine-hydrolyzing) n=1 Tax=Pacificispira spongiicola TaxID=2729598 RepID=A0A7Y0E1N9_9PROT|nr:asparagine synthase C-terminal domain-containing protein [Pacificispira spongiicola]NMM45595.1 asparagine synthase [Pacificispira spongiicola]